MSIFVAGGAGYIGTALVEQILSCTDHTVTVLDSLLYGGESLLQFSKNDRFTFIRGDVRTFDLASLGDFDFVVNLSALVGEPICKMYPKEARQVNFEANIRMAKYFESSNVPRYIFASTCSNYGIADKNSMAKEDAVMNPVSLYSRTKVDSEKILLDELPGLPAIVLRFATAYGLAPRIRFDLLLHQFIRDAWEHKKIKIFGGESWRPVVHVEDIARSIIMVMSKNKQIEHKDVFNVGSNEQNYQKAQLARMITDRLDAEIEKVESVKDPRDYQVSFDKIHEMLRYKTYYTPEQAVDEIATGLESGLITKEMLANSVNVADVHTGH